MLYARKVAAPDATIVDIARALEQLLPGPASKEVFERIPDVLPRLAKVLCGSEFEIVPRAILAEAAHREKVIGGLKHGWGAFVPPPATAAHYLLVSSGLPSALLPPYTPLPAAVREHFLDAWTAICRQFGWDPCIHPREIASMKRIISKELRASASGSGTAPPA